MSALEPLANFPCYVMTVTSAENHGNSLDMTVSDIQAIGLNPKIVYRQKDPESGRRGCYQSHQYTLSLFLRESSSPYALIFEEDAQILSKDIAINSFSKLQTLQEIHSAWDILSLGSHFDESITVSPGILKSKSFIEAHAYFVSRAGAAKIISWPYAERAYDIEFRFQDVNVYIVRPSAFIQRHIYATNGGGFDMKYTLTSLGLGNAVLQYRIWEEEGSLWKMYLGIFVAVFAIIFFIKKRKF